MSSNGEGPTGPDLTRGIPQNDIPDGGSVAGQVGGEAVLLARRGAEWFAIGATCTHYGGPLPEGLIVGDTVRCPWHHACFSLRTGESLRPPALRDLACYAVEQRDGKVFVTGKRAPEPHRPGARRPEHPSSVVIVGGGAAGDSAAATLRREGFAGPITILDGDPDAPYDRPNCSKDYLAGNAPEEWLPLRPEGFEREQSIERRRGRVVALEPRERRVRLEDGATLEYGALLLATGASPIRLAPEVDSGGTPVHYLRSLADSRAIIARTEGARRAVVLGASFIGLEVAASLRARELEVHVVAPGALPLQGVLGDELGRFVKGLHEEHGVVFHLGQKPRGIGTQEVLLENGKTLPADFVVAGIGVTPNLQLAESAGLALDRGLTVNERLQTSAPGIFAAGDIARWPDPHTGERIRVEHWVVAQRQGRAAARAMLGSHEPYDHVPFFWSQHYDVPIAYTGHAERWDSIEVDGDIEGRDCTVRYRGGGRVLAVATIYRDRESLAAEVAMEQGAFY
ncbi:MAG: FAD-dependent oxidoreductase [Gemmatimonadales bacterium]|nr:FAD-dependent oxidoreductase [Gemmatimonadales bacterium]